MKTSPSRVGKASILFVDIPKPWSVPGRVYILNNGGMNVEELN